MLSDSWFFFDNGVFLETGGPQGHGRDFYFWDTKNNRYSAIGPVEITYDDFISIFDPEKINWDADDTWSVPEAFTESNLVPPHFLPGDIKKIESYGRRYYEVQFTKTYLNRFLGERYASYREEQDPYFPATWYRKPDDTWELIMGPGLGQFSSIRVSPNSERMVYDVIMDEAERDAK
jgi:hypothetical protein